MTSKDIQNAAIGDTLWDDQVKGLHLRVFPGKKVFYLYFRTKQHRQKRPKLGPYGILTLAGAREIARTTLANHLMGKVEATQYPNRTVQDLYNHWEEVHLYEKLKEGSRREYKRSWKVYILPAMGKSYLDEVTERQCQELYHSLHKTPSQANRVMATLRAGFNLAEDWGWKPRNTNPMQVTLKKEPARERYPDASESVRLIKALDAGEKDDPLFVNYIWLLALTGARPGELLTAKWEWITPDGLRLPAAKRKEFGRTIALSEEARDVLSRIPKTVRNPYIFPGRRKGRHAVNYNKLWHALLGDAKVTDLQMRDLRRYFASITLSGGISLDEVGQLLGHTQSQTTRRYAYLMKGKRQEAVEKTSTELIRLRVKAREKESHP